MSFSGDHRTPLLPVCDLGNALQPVHTLPAAVPSMMMGGLSRDRGTLWHPVPGALRLAQGRRGAHSQGAPPFPAPPLSPSASDSFQLGSGHSPHIPAVLHPGVPLRTHTRGTGDWVAVGSPSHQRDPRNPQSHGFLGTPALPSGRRDKGHICTRCVGGGAAVSIFQDAGGGQKLAVFYEGSSQLWGAAGSRREASASCPLCDLPCQKLCGASWGDPWSRPLAKMPTTS